MSIERESGYYDDIYRESEEYKKPGDESVYFQLWQHVIDLLPNDTHITELGCGTGQFAELLQQALGSPYSGYDFSIEAISQAIKREPDAFFLRADLRDRKFTEDENFFVALEIFEHTDDYQLIKNLGFGKEIVFTVPDFSDEAHIRYFHSVNEVVERYKNVLKFERIQKFEKWFICKAVTI